jgi:tRNA threonylcarbamoyladenosine biosynthesis protein TsaB
MRILCVDTSTRQNWVGLYTDGRITDCIGYEDRQSCLVNLMPSISTLLNNAQTNLKALDGVATVIGPGAWSSLRIGMAAVKQLCLINRLPLMTINNLDLIAETVLRSPIFPMRPDYLLSAMDAQSGRVYSALYQITGKQKILVSPYAWETVDKTAERLASQTETTLIIGDAASLFREDELISCLPMMPQASSDYLRILGDMASETNPIYNHDEIASLKPLYIQPSSAEVEFNVSVT